MSKLKIQRGRVDLTKTAEPDSLSRSDKIALGVGLGIGIPTIILMVVAMYLRSR
jgi:hypothetical protein